MKDADLKAWLEARFDRVEGRLDGIEKVQVRQEAVLDEHIRRTLALEDSTDVLKKNLEPIRTHVAVMGAVAKVGLALISVAGALAGILKALG